MVGVGIISATVAAFVVSAVFYGVATRGQPPQSSLPVRAPLALVTVELARNAAVGGLVAGLLVAADWDGGAAGLRLGLALSIIPVVLLAGAVFHEGAPIGRSALHAADWILKLTAIGVIIALFT